MQTFREALREAAMGRQQLIALETFEGKPTTAESELSKYLRGERGERVFALIDNVFRFGDREILKSWMESRLAPPNAGEALARIGTQLDLFDEKIELLRQQFDALADVIPIERARR